MAGHWLGAGEGGGGAPPIRVHPCPQGREALGLPWDPSHCPERPQAMGVWEPALTAAPPVPSGSQGAYPPPPVMPSTAAASTQVQSRGGLAACPWGRRAFDWRGGGR